MGGEGPAGWHRHFEDGPGWRDVSMPWLVGTAFGVPVPVAVAVTAAIGIFVAVAVAVAVTVLFDGGVLAFELLATLSHIL